MREPNISFPSQNRAVVCITTALYDRIALDCTATLPLINSLTHLAYLTSTSPRIREILCSDGGLERLILILSPAERQTDKHSLWKWSLAFQCVCNIGIRGTEHLRLRVIEAGILPIVVKVLEVFIQRLGLVRFENSNFTKPTCAALSTITSYNTTNQLSSSSISGSLTQKDTLTHYRRTSFPYKKPSAEQRRLNRKRSLKIPVNAWYNISGTNNQPILHIEQDNLLSLQLLAFLSKYAHIRNLLHSAYDKNIFSIVEKFTQRTLSKNIQNWASIVMRNGCRKDEDNGNIRRCANLSCNKWESEPREFARCRRCRKAKYCSKSCQSKAWSGGHRWWCTERRSSMSIWNHHSVTSNSTMTINDPTNTTTDNVQSVIDQGYSNTEQTTESSTERVEHGSTNNVLTDLSVTFEL
ncbi:hypothetical protein BDB01DRAFT_798330 [Pilobolus umbonatus]|nr:hypothetical protein BDB01DRAFT_798330 [Pilobolus umbonatus]